MNPVQENIITEEVWSTLAGLNHYRCVSAIGSHYKTYKIRINIESGNFEDQGRANVEVWSGHTMTWNQIHNIPGPLMKSYKACVESAQRNRRVNSVCFGEDAQELVKVACIVLGLSPVPSDDEE
jgi:hypothetical protein